MNLLNNVLKKSLKCIMKRSDPLYQVKYLRTGDNCNQCGGHIFIDSFDNKDIYYCRRVSFVVTHGPRSGQYVNTMTRFNGFPIEIVKIIDKFVKENEIVYDDCRNAHCESDYIDLINNIRGILSQ